MVMRAALMAALASSACADTTTICALVSEPAAATLACPPGTVIQNFSLAVFGTFSPTSSCAGGLSPLPACPVPVLAQAARLCTGSATCSLSCDCDALPAPCVFSYSSRLFS
jgi:hypothetical protein